jgi:peroxiredoxin
MRRGDSLPHFSVTTVDGRRVEYADLWQRKNVVLVTVPAEGSAAGYASHLLRDRERLSAHNTACVVTADPLDGLPPASVVIADQWGEIQFIATGQPAEALPTVAELVEWLEHVQHQCPECQGETR